MTHSNHWERHAIAMHEAAHAVAAQDMGLRVAWVSIDPVDAVQEHHLGATGIEIEGEADDEHKLAVKLDLSDRPELLGLCVSIAMASYVSSPSLGWIDRYSVIELRQALSQAERGGIHPEDVERHCERIKDERWDEICDLANRLVTEGRVEFSSV